MFLIISLFLVCPVFVFCESSVPSFVDTLGKCKINDGACEKELLQSVIRDIAKTGVPEFGIPPIDPITIKNMSMSVLDAIDFTLIEGTIKGGKDCVVNRFETLIEDERAFIEIVCDFSAKGQYKVYSNSPLIKSFIGGDSLSGEGNGKIKIEKLRVKLDFDFFIQRRNGELYIQIKSDKIKYSYDIGKVVFFADSLYIGKQESSKIVTGLLNQNWRTLLSSFGKPYTDMAMEYLHDFLKKFFSTVPAKHYISDDLSKYAKDA